MLQSFLTPARICEESRQKIELGAQIGGCGSGHKAETVIADTEIIADIAPGQDTREIVLAVSAQPARSEDRAGNNIDTVHGARLQLTATEVHADAHRTVLEIGLLEGDTDTIGKAQADHAEIVDRLTRDDLAGRTEITIGEMGHVRDGRRLDRLACTV